MKVAVSSEMIPYLRTCADKMTGANDIRTALEKISAAGYEGVMLDVSKTRLPAVQQKKYLEECHLLPAGLLVDDYSMLKETDKREQLLKDCLEMGCEYISFTGLDREALLDAGRVKEISNVLEGAAAAAKEQGISLALRVKAACFIRREGQPVIEEILAQTNALMVEWNTYDMTVGGAYILEWLEKTKDRTLCVQFEDYQIDEESDTTFLECTHHMPSGTVGKGSINWKAVLKACDGIQWGCVTARRPQSPIYRSAADSLTYLKGQMEV